LAILIGAFIEEGKIKDVAKKTPLYNAHVNAKAKMVEFAGFDMPLHYGSQIQEHHQVRQRVGVFDVSHMGMVDLQGEAINKDLRYILANNIDRMTIGKALYTCMLNEQGGVLDDLIVYKMSNNNYRMIINAATKDKDLQWLKEHLSPTTVLLDRRDLAMIAVQGPEALTALKQVLPNDVITNLEALKPFSFIEQNDLFIARTGYTGEDGFELIVHNQSVEALWQRLIANNVAPCGLGARDTLRLEAGLNLYGLDMDEHVTPLESNLAWTVAFEPLERDFIGRKALTQQKQGGLSDQLVGLVLQGPGVLRHGQKVIVQTSDGEQEGVITSGGYSPTLNLSIALARIPLTDDPQCQVEIRQKAIQARIIKPPFVRKGRKVFVD
jgi:aminomethyltransferase